jgi:hypothetical protein
MYLVMMAIAEQRLSHECGWSGVDDEGLMWGW